MFKKWLSMLILIYLILCAPSCYSAKTVNMENLRQRESFERKIFFVEKANGEKIEFSKKNPGRIVGDQIRGPILTSEGKWKSFSIPLVEVMKVGVKKFSFRKLIRTSLIIPLAFLPIYIISAIVGK